MTTESKELSAVFVVVVVCLTKSFISFFNEFLCPSLLLLLL